MLKQDNNTLRFYAIHALANLARVDHQSKFEKILNDFYSILNGDSQVLACHVAYVSGKIANAKPELANEIAKRLLNTDRASYKHKELVQANTLKAFSEFFDKISNKEKVVDIARTLQAVKSPRAAEEAEIPAGSEKPSTPLCWCKPIQEQENKIPKPPTSSCLQRISAAK